MDAAYCEKLVVALRVRNIEFAPGLTNKEVGQTEALYGFRFPPDLRALLQYALPVSEGFVNWRADSEEVIGWRIEEPFLGLLASVEHSGFWVRRWGRRPDALADALRLAQTILQKAPRLIPVYQQRYLPTTPCLAGNPVLSVWCADIIYYGVDLADYFVKEFQAGYPARVTREQHPADLPPLPPPDRIPHALRPLRFWDDVIAEWG